MTIDLDLAAIQDFATGILIRALVGVEREKRRDTEVIIGGIRTFVLMAIRMIIDTYFEPNKTLQELRKILGSGHMDLLRQFSEACRDDLRNFRSI